MHKLPSARKTDLVIQELKKEILIYDLKINKAYCLNKTAAVVWQACDGKTLFEELKSKSKFSDDLIYLALDELKKQDLIEGERFSYLAGVTRREAIRRAGLSSMIALPLINTLIAPKAVHAQSGNNTGCIGGQSGSHCFCFGPNPANTPCGQGVRFSVNCACQAGLVCLQDNLDCGDGFACGGTCVLSAS